jgi:hypothetical protein
MLDVVAFGKEKLASHQRSHVPSGWKVGKLGTKPHIQKRYQVFVSSTYDDLKEERREVMQALLKTECIPTGMELFPAANDDSLTHIKRFIAQCDYYIVIVAGRYGSLGTDDKSFTELEYDFAIAAHVPVLASLHGEPSNIPAGKTESTDKGRQALQAFRDKIEANKYVNYWTSPKELAVYVCLSMMSAITRNPRIGWVRANLAPDESAAQEILRLSNNVKSYGHSWTSLQQVDGQTQKISHKARKPLR